MPAEWMPVIIMVITVLTGMFINNKRIDDMSRRIDDTRDLLRAEIRASQSELLAALVSMESRLTSRIDDLSRRIEVLERQRV
jgi:hypothetical protein